MIYLEHLNLVVNNIEKSLAFYQAAFPDWKVRGQGKGEWSGKARTWLHFGDDNQYLAFSDHGEGVSRDNSGFSVGLAHFAFVVTDIDGVITRLNAAGFKVDKVGDGAGYRRNVYFFDPDGIEIEFVEYFSDRVDQRNDYQDSDA